MRKVIAPRRITIPKRLLTAIRGRAETGYPDEICGFLLGEIVSTNLFISAKILPVDNRRSKETHRRYRIDPQDYRAADRRATAAGRDIVGVYHSHPDAPAVPSDYDRDHAWPNCAYVIASVAGGASRELTAWILTDDRSAFLPLEVDQADEETRMLEREKARTEGA